MLFYPAMTRTKVSGSCIKKTLGCLHPLKLYSILEETYNALLTSIARHKVFTWLRLRNAQHLRFGFFVVSRPDVGIFFCTPLISPASTHYVVPLAVSCRNCLRTVSSSFFFSRSFFFNTAKTFFLSASRIFSRRVMAECGLTRRYLLLSWP